MHLHQTWANHGQRANPARRHLHKLKLPPWIERKTFFVLQRSWMTMIFKKNKPQRCKIGIKTRWKLTILEITFVRGPWSQKKVFTLFFNQSAARGFNSFSKSGPSGEKLAHPWLLPCPYPHAQFYWAESPRTQQHNYVFLMSYKKKASGFLAQ